MKKLFLSFIPIMIVSDKRRKDGVPYIIHNAGPYTIENDYIQHWPSPIIYHFRFPCIKDTDEAGQSNP